MPDWKTHLVYSLFLVIAWLNIFYLIGISLGLFTILTLFVFTIFPSLFADVDMKKSKIRDVFSIVISTLVAVAYLIFFIESWYYAFVYFILLYFILKYIPTKHRGVTHSFKFSLIFSLAITAIYFIFNQFTFEKFVLWFTVVFSSYCVHLVTDKL